MARVEFGKRLQRVMMAKGLSQSELARLAEMHLGKHFGRDSVSQYIRGETLPNPQRLGALSKALGVEPEELLPSRGVRGVPSLSEMMRPGLEVRDDADERYQQVNLVGQRVKKERMKELLAIIYDVD
jgi:transcriptional regulator with XRE-family HTH domain